MTTFRLSKPASTDLRQIGSYTKRKWGRGQARRYLGEIDACFRRLAEQPELGRAADDIRPGLLRIEQGRHVIFYRRTDFGIRAIRVLHGRMLPGLHFTGHIDDE